MSSATISVNKKLPDGTLISVGGTSYDDLYQNLLAIYNGNEEPVNDILKEFRQVLIPTSAGSIADATANVARAFPQATPAPSTGGTTPQNCDHGMARVPKSGTSATGKAWSALMCPMPKGQSCQPVWVR